MKYLICGILGIAIGFHIHSNPDYYSNCLVLLESQGRKHYQNQKGIPGGNKGYFC